MMKTIAGMCHSNMRYTKAWLSSSRFKVDGCDFLSRGIWTRGGEGDERGKKWGQRMLHTIWLELIIVSYSLIISKCIKYKTDHMVEITNSLTMGLYMYNINMLTFYWLK